MTEIRPAVAALVAEMLAMANDPERQNKIAAAEAARTDPWTWYCRICGDEGSDPSRMVRNDQAHDHASRCPRPGLPNLGQSEAGRLLHVWAYGDLPLSPTIEVRP